MAINTNSDKYVEAIRYLGLGFSIIPIGADKKPLVQWIKYQQERPTVTELNAWFEKFGEPNIGIITGSISDLCVIDADSEEAIKAVEEILTPELVVPTVTTPRGGKHYYFRNDSQFTTRANVLPKVDTRGEGGYVVAPPSCNENGESWRWVVDLSFDLLAKPPERAIRDIACINNNKSTLYKGDVISPEKSVTSHYTSYKVLQSGNRDEDLFHVANWLLKGGRGEDYVRQILEILAKNCNPPFSEKEMNEKIMSALKRRYKREGSLADEVKELCMLQECYISVTDILQTLQCVTKEDRTNVRVIVKRLCDSGFLEKCTDKKGTYRVRAHDTQEMDIKTEPKILETPVRLPIQLNKLCVISPGNIVMVSGSKSSGKTAFQMNIADLNQNDFNVKYLNSEMSDTEFKKRLKKFRPLQDWNIKAYRCHNNFEDYIESDPKNLYIIDFLEIHDNFYEIAKPIRKIHEKLGESICFIALQMKSGEKLGRGGDFSAEKARLYLTMDYQPTERCTKVTIYDAKEPRPPHESVRGMFRNIKVIDGSNLVMSTTDQWRR